MKKLLLVLSIALVTCANVSWARCGYQEVKAADERWEKALESGDPFEITRLYEEDAILVPTFSNHILTNNVERFFYFKKLHDEVPELYVKFDHHNNHIQLFDGGAVSSGLYSFKGTTDEGEPIIISDARYTFVYKDMKDSKDVHHGCKLITHNSSELPENPPHPKFDL